MSNLNALQKSYYDNPENNLDPDGIGEKIMQGINNARVLLKNIDTDNSREKAEWSNKLEELGIDS
ncbi:MAG: hypothetical protein HC836_47090 [Richelia sp. RM2_1_2]|nr:hypothetical protein [Richelia sp. RM2_1_2]